MLEGSFLSTEFLEVIPSFPSPYISAVNKERLDIVGPSTDEGEVVPEYFL
jgi:hypothetical protein